MLHKLTEHSLLPPAALRLLPAFERKELVQEPVEMRLAVLADVRAVSLETVQPVELVGIERIVGPVLARRLEHLRQVFDALARPGVGMVASGHSELDGLLLAARQPLRAKAIELRPGQLQRIHRHLRRDLAIVPLPKHAGDCLGTYPFVYLLLVHCNGTLSQIRKRRNRLKRRFCKPQIPWASKMRHFF